MKTYPIKAIDFEKAKKMQFKLVDIIHQNFDGYEFLQDGDYGVVPGVGQPRYTQKVERVLAQFFGAEEAVLVRGSGTGAIRNVMNGVLKPNGKILLHKAPIYPTTKIIVESMGLEPQYIDFNKICDIKIEDLSHISFVLIQHSRQKLEDRYDLNEVINKLKSVNNDMTILVDDNYVVMKAEKIGVQLGADVSAFSLFKLLGPEGLGCVAGKGSIIDKIRQMNYSGGSQVQGHEAMNALRSLVYAPVSLAIQAEEGNKIVYRLNSGEVRGIKSSFIANAQSRVVLVEFEKPIAKDVLKYSSKLGAAPYPIGAESKYEVTAMFYRVSGTFLKSNPKLEDYMIRINPMRAGADTVIRVLKEAIDKALE
ncbi:aminotransferase class V-fold PLP-dependent enzyme [Maledivibacter halophilus]|uniref:Cystathionine beta-lyase family protein involved in aluminum resistance n=1 Tax=Maledivibacter halophilus TaxID=36842 RepID=A0A1T5M0X4_9FIRM|nr:aminotransferase class V-fold PLP-dependent enzyme [Maledivibacter halophilus]SKC81753.1 Cystathionine beta-lyase family protein involved in aluminum resistance [Maledivibacter halophilus]